LFDGLRDGGTGNAYPDRPNGGGGQSSQPRRQLWKLRMLQRERSGLPRLAGTIQPTELDAGVAGVDEQHHAGSALAARTDTVPTGNGSATEGTCSSIRPLSSTPAAWPVWRLRPSSMMSIFSTISPSTCA